MSHQNNNNAGGRQSGTMGESTRLRLAGLIQAAKPDAGAAAGGDRPRTPGGAAYVGGFQGGLAGSWGRAATGRSPASSVKASNPLLGGQAPRPSAALVQARQAEIAREFHPKPERVRPASSGARNLWDVLPPKGSSSFNRRQQQQQHLSAARPRSAAPRLQQLDLMDSADDGRQAPEAYKLRGSALGGGGAAAAAAAAGRNARALPLAQQHLGFDSSSSSHGLPGGTSPAAARAAAPPAGSSAASFSFGSMPFAAAAAGQLGPSSSSAATAGAGGAAAAELTEARLAALDDAIRDAVRSRRSVAQDSKTLLLRLFKEVDDGSGDVDAEEFCAVCARLGVAVSVPEAAALFRRAGCCDGVMPYAKWAHNLINQPSRRLAQETSVRKGAFQPGQSAGFSGKIIYEECRKPVWTPSDWDARLADRSAELPDARVSLEFAYGYAGGQTTSQNLLYNSAGHAVYVVAGVGVAYRQPPGHSQSFFLGHTDDIKSLAVCPAAVGLGEDVFPARSLVATGQVSSVAAGPVICVWDSRTAAAAGPAAASATAAAAAGAGAAPVEVSRLQLDKELRGIVALGFSPDDALLASVATDNSHTISVYDWRAGWRLVGEGKGCMGEPTQVFGVEWNSHQLTHDTPPAFVTFGKKHIKLWRPAGPGGAWAATQLSFGKLPLQNVCAAAFLLPAGARRESAVAAGMADGQVYLFRGTSAVACVAAHKPGPKNIQPDGQPAYEGLRGMRLCRQGGTLLTGGADGVIMQWDVSDGSLTDRRFAGPAITLAPPSGGDKPPIVRSLDFSETSLAAAGSNDSSSSSTSGGASGTILLGTLDSCVLEVAADGGRQAVLVSGHAHDVWAVAFHPEQPNIAATVCDGNRVWVWDLAARSLLRSASVGFVCRAVQFSSVPYGGSSGTGGGSGGCFHIAVGGAKGHIRVVTEAELRPMWEGRDSMQGVSELDYSPDGRLLAAATFDAWIDVYNVEKGYQRIARCSGHSATVRTIDWSADSSVLQSNCAAREILYWNARTGKQVPGSCRDVVWAGWTCLYGFPVMGIWPDKADGSDINACDRSKSGRYLATADDYGLVKLFSHPVVVEAAPHRAYRGHSSHVMCVRFNADDSLVCSTGGKDWAMFQFRVLPAGGGAGGGGEGGAAGAVGGAGAATAAAVAAAAGAAVGKKAGGPKGARPEMVWGVLDASGKNFGWVPADKAAAQQQAAAAAGTTAAASFAAAGSIEQPHPAAGGQGLQQQHWQPAGLVGELQQPPGVAAGRGDAAAASAQRSWQQPAAAAEDDGDAGATIEETSDSLEEL